MTIIRSNTVRCEQGGMRSSSTSRSAHAIPLLSMLAALGLAGCSAGDAADPSDETADEGSIASQESLLSAPDEDYVTTPAGKLHKSCVYEDKGEGNAAIAPCRYKSKRNAALNGASTSAVQVPGVNWVENSFVAAPAATPWYGQAYSAWTVPSNPTSISNQLIYYFPAFENSSGATTIIQPVMQWGNNGVFGGNYWTITSWYVNGQNIGAHSTPVTVTTGQIIDGSMVASFCSVAGSCSWTITTKVRNGGAANSTTLFVFPGVVYNWAAPAVLENYNMTACNQYPANPGLYISTDLYLTTSSVKSTLPWTNILWPVTPSCHFAVTNSPNPGTSLLTAY